MAGLFGNLSNYDKPGPGIDKNEPKKKGISLYFSILKDKFWKLIPLSLLFILTMLPVVTIGFSEAASAYVTRNFARRKPVILASDYFETIKKNWKQALVVGIINLLVTAVIILAMFFYYQGWNISFFYKVGFVIAGCIFIVFTFLKYYINMLIVTFDLSIKQLYKNSMLLSSAGLKQNVTITLILVVLYAITFGIPTLWYYITNDLIGYLFSALIIFLFLPAVRSYTMQFWVFPVIKQHMIDPYYKEHPEAAKKDRALLNLFDDEEESEKTDGEEVVFKDIGTKEKQVEATADSNIPKQYSKKELQHHRKRHRNDDDDTI